MNQMLDKLMSLKKGKKQLPDAERDAKMSAAKEFGDLAKSAMGERMKGLKKVTVASDSPEGLEEGLEKAQEMVDPEESEDEMGPKYCDENSSLEEIDAEMERLAALKEAKMSEEAPEVEELV